MGEVVRASSRSSGSKHHPQSLHISEWNRRENLSTRPNARHTVLVRLQHVREELCLDPTKNQGTTERDPIIRLGFRTSYVVDRQGDIVAK